MEMYDEVKRCKIRYERLDKNV